MAANETEQGAFAWASGTAASGTGGNGSPVPALPVLPRIGRAARAQGRAGQSEPWAATLRAPPAAEPLPPDNELWDVRAAARFLKRSVSWVYHRAEDGTLPVKRLGGWGLRFIPAEVRAWVERQDTKAGRAR